MRRHFVLVVCQDPPEMRRALEVHLEGKVDYIWGRTYTEAGELFLLNQDHLDVIVVCPFDSLSVTLTLITQFRSEGYEGPMIASTADAVLGEQLIEAGCSSSAAPDEVGESILAILGLDPPE